MAERIEMGYLNVVIKLGDIELPNNTPVTVKITSDRCIVTVIYGEYDGLEFTIPEERVDEWVTLVM